MPSSIPSSIWSCTSRAYGYLCTKCRQQHVPCMLKSARSTSRQEAQQHAYIYICVLPVMDTCAQGNTLNAAHYLRRTGTLAIVSRTSSCGGAADCYTTTVLFSQFGIFAKNTIASPDHHRFWERTAYVSLNNRQIKEMGQAQQQNHTLTGRTTPSHGHFTYWFTFTQGSSGR